MMCDVTVRIVLSSAIRSAVVPSTSDGLVNVTSLPSAAPPIVQAHLVVRVAVGAANPSAKISRDTWHAISGARGIGGENGADLLGQCVRHALVRIKGKNPVVARGLGRKVLLGDYPGQSRTMTCAVYLASDRDGVVGAATIDDDDFVGPLDGLERASQVGLLVPGDNRDREPRHAGSVSPGLAKSPPGGVPRCPRLQLWLGRACGRLAGRAAEVRCPCRRSLTRDPQAAAAAQGHFLYGIEIGQ